GYVLAALEVADHGGNGPDGSPGDAPPAQEQRNRRVAQALVDATFIGAHKVHRSTLEGHDQYRDAITVGDEFPAALDLKVDLVGLHPLQSLHLGHNAPSKEC